MKLKDKVMTFLLCLFIIGLFFVSYSFKNMQDDVNHVYNVYLNNDIIGSITDKDALYDLINKKQAGVKEKYHVDRVYPPESLSILEDYSYNYDISSVDEIYNKIEEKQDFTILGYEVTFSAYQTNNSEVEDDANSHDAFSIYILDKQVLEDALNNFVLAFIDEESYNNYINGNQGSLDEVGIIYSNLDILEDIIIREKYISINEKIYETSEELTQQLLFGFDYVENTYKVKEGDTIASISEANQLNPQEFLIANPRYNSKNSLLTIGENVNITLINPEITFSYMVDEMTEAEEAYSTIVERDNTQEPGYEEIRVLGVTGLTLQTKRYSVLNGEPLNNVEFSTTPITIREKVDQVVVKGRAVSSGMWNDETYEYGNTGWRWPTVAPYAITSDYEWRWGRQHNGLDISGTPANAYIMASTGGTVVDVNTSCPNNGYYGNRCGGTFGNYVVIDHGNNEFTLYAHLLQNVIVKVGDVVSTGQPLGYMGNSGSSTGRHLHFAYSIGHPFHGGTYHSPWELFPR